MVMDDREVAIRVEYGGLKLIDKFPALTHERHRDIIDSLNRCRMGNEKPLEEDCYAIVGELLTALATLRTERDSLRAVVVEKEQRWRARNILMLEVSGRGDMLTKKHVNPDALDGLVAIQNEFDRLRNIVIRDLDTELASAKEETERLKTGLRSLDGHLATAHSKAVSECIEKVKAKRREYSSETEGAYPLLVSVLNDLVTLLEAEAEEK